MQSRALLSALALLAFACSSSTDNSNTNTDTTHQLNCSSDTECDTGFKCDREQRRCVCTSDAACPSGKFCNAFSGVCVDSVGGCTSDSVCKAGQYCDRGLRTCKPITQVCGTCKTDAQCGSGSKCAAHPDFPNAGTFCVPLCVSGGDAGTAGCPAGLTCRATDASAGATQICVPKTGACGVSNACTPDSLAVCHSNTDCTDATQQCDTSLAQCVAKNRVCPAGDACDPQQRVCVHTCDVDSDCTAIEGGNGYRCRNNACFKLTTCNLDTDCAVGAICSPNPDGSKSCRPGCTQATDCPLAQGCNNDPQHPRCNGGCTQNSDCPLNTVCNAGACVSTFGGCSQACQSTAVCPVGSYCSSSNCCVATALSSVCAPGCTASVQNNCYSVYIRPCNNTNECTNPAPSTGLPALPGTTCVAAAGSTYCRGTVQVKPCTGASDCLGKGFVCSSYGNGPVCFPFETPAEAACIMGHP
ncbi:MAG: hypothetical protein JST92_09985 [Deltaproteobacteria bacterium]|nr:hypothetical protein [Deltaproteobacteria bacterium]